MERPPLPTLRDRGDFRVQTNIVLEHLLDTSDTHDESINELQPGSGITAERPLATAVPVGSSWFDTTLGHPIWSDGTDWVDASGVAV